MPDFENAHAVRIGAEVSRSGRTYRITHLLSDFRAAQVEDISTGKLEIRKFTDLYESEKTEPIAAPNPDLAQASTEDWEVAKQRAAAADRLIALGRPTRAEVAAEAKALGFSAQTMYRWLSIYREMGTTSSLLPPRRFGISAGPRVPSELENVIQLAIETVYLNGQRRTASATIDEVLRLCRSAGIQPPHPNTVRRRINKIPQSTQLKRRSRRKEAADKFDPRPGHFVAAERPLAIVQVDHTKVDIELVDEEHRLDIGRPWLTLVFDVFSRMVLGFCLSLEPPSAASTGIALAHAILPKDEWLAKRSLTNSWPCFGLPAMVHLDNAREFRGEMLRRACDQYKIEVNFRPVATPHYGAHIERGLGTLSKAIHELPGSTFSNPTERGEYNSQKAAALTLSELEIYLAEYITGIYHNKFHTGIDMAPIKRWRDSILGSPHQPGMGLSRPKDPERLRLDFMPVEERTIQNYGIQIDKINYYDDALRPYINDKVGRSKRKFVFRRDPTDISRVYFWDPKLSEYTPIPYRSVGRSAITLWELRAVRRQLESEGRKAVDEEAIFASYDRLRRIQDNASKETKRIRRERARKANRASNIAHSEDPKPASNVISFPTNIRPFEIDRG